MTAAPSRACRSRVLVNSGTSYMRTKSSTILQPDLVACRTLTYEIDHEGSIVSVSLHATNETDELIPTAGLASSNS